MELLLLCCNNIHMLLVLSQQKNWEIFTLNIYITIVALYSSVVYILFVYIVFFVHVTAGTSLGSCYRQNHVAKKILFKVQSDKFLKLYIVL